MVMSGSVVSVGGVDRRELRRRVGGTAGRRAFPETLAYPFGGLEELVAAGESMCTDAEVLQEILHR
jgi:hypothetical protein